MSFDGDAWADACLRGRARAVRDHARELRDHAANCLHGDDGRDTSYRRGRRRIAAACEEAAEVFERAAVACRPAGTGVDRA